jgi:hypothetical protein
MKRIALALLICTASLVYCLPAAPVYAAVAISPAQGPVNSYPAVTGLTENATFAVKWDGGTILTGTVPAGGTIYFPVPENPRGAHSVIVENPVGTAAYTGSFSITPSFEIYPDIGSFYGELMTVTGRGFGANESGIFVTFDGIAIVQMARANSAGTWYASFPVPISIGGMHYVNAFGSVTHLGEAPNRNFFIRPKVTMTPDRGCVGTTVTLTASGFGSLETGIGINFDGTTIKMGMVSNPDGTWKASFVVPNSSRGYHSIWVYGDMTRGYDISNLAFTVTASAFIEPLGGKVGDTIRIYGKGFAGNESGITVSYDQVNMLNGIQADGQGTWAASIVIPPSVSGMHAIGAFGNETTSLNCSNTILTVQPAIMLNPIGGNVGDAVAITGTGFGGQRSITVTYGGSVVLSGVTTDSSGSFTGSFKAPGGRSGPVNVTANDNVGGAGTAVFAMETTPPPVPQLVSPESGKTVGIIGSSRVDFTWTDVYDPSGVFYTLEVSTQPSFSNVVVRAANLTKPDYSLTEAEALPHGDYYWRVRAVDGATNSSNWTTPQPLKVSYISTLLFIIIVAVIMALIIAGVVVWIVFRSKKKNQRGAKTDIKVMDKPESKAELNTGENTEIKLVSKPENKQDEGKADSGK